MPQSREPVTLERLPDVLARAGNSRSGLYSAVKQGLFVPPVRLGPRAVGWVASEVSAILRARIAGVTEAQLRQIVEGLVAARTEEVVPTPTRRDTQ